MNDRQVWLSDLIELANIAVAAGVSRSSVYHWVEGRGTAADHPFPPAVHKFGTTRVWLWSEVEPWLRAYADLKQPGHRTDLERDLGVYPTGGDRSEPVKAKPKLEPVLPPKCKWSGGCKRLVGNLKPDQVFCNPHQRQWDGPAQRNARGQIVDA